MKEIANALCVLQSLMKPAVKDAENPFFKSNYADLQAVWKTAQPFMKQCGLAVSQLPYDDGEKIGVKTVLVHSSGELIQTQIAMKPQKLDPQAIGSLLTYLRRYSLASVLGIVTSDDDAESAMDRVYTIDIGKKYLGKRLDEVSAEELISFKDWLIKQANGKELGVKEKRFVEELGKFIAGE